ncbi:MAG TPA: 16S rRNA (guanine(527)-N(7))-methyltransferase RsmG [Sphingomicrobium sp.]|nr:16S rRNA (guanine(527)-N(7))-methyltransferase RsmG [Sphingomicrobium sp.]
MIETLAAAAGRPVSRETYERLELYAARLRTESARQNLVSAASLHQLWNRHILDSAQLVRFEPHTGASWVDIGSGAGLPGVVLACLVDGPLTLVEPRRLRAEFLRSVVEELGLDATVESGKVERVTGRFDVITGRAVASLSRFLHLCDHLSTGNTVWVLPKGRGAQSELEEARRSWQGVFHVEQSITEADAKIVVATRVRAKR